MENRNNNQLIPTKEEIEIYTHIAKHANESKFFEKMGKEGGILTLMLFAREIGISPMTALFGGLNNIQGKVEISPRLMNTMIRKAGHRLNILECTDSICRIKGTRNDSKEDYTCSYTLDEAKKAGLVRSGSGWEKYASDMLFARCLSRLARRLFADVISSSYVEGELSDAEYVDRADRVQSPGKSEQLFGNPVQFEKAEPVVEAAVVKDNLITEEEFLDKLHEKYPEVNLGLMHGYISKIETEKSVKGYQIMQQALNSALTSRFMKGYESWMNAQLEADSLTDEAMRK